MHRPFFFLIWENTVHPFKSGKDSYFFSTVWETHSWIIIFPPNLELLPHASLNRQPGGVFFFFFAFFEDLVSLKFLHRERTYLSPEMRKWPKIRIGTISNILRYSTKLYVTRLDGKAVRPPLAPTQGGLISLCAMRRDPTFPAFGRSLQSVNNIVCLALPERYARQAETRGMGLELHIRAA